MTLGCLLPMSGAAFPCPALLPADWPAVPPGGWFPRGHGTAHLPILFGFSLQPVYLLYSFKASDPPAYVA